MRHIQLAVLAVDGTNPPTGVIATLLSAIASTLVTIAVARLIDWRWPPRR